jgi:hypothetical protein
VAVEGSPGQRRESTTGVLFLFWLYRRTAPGSTDETALLLVPFFFFHRVGQEALRVFVLPFWYSRSPTGWSAGIVPFFTIARTTSGATTVSLFLIFWLRLEEDFYLFTVFPLVWVAGSSTSFAFFVVPFFWFYNDSSGPTLFLFPFFLLSTSSSSFHLAVFPAFHISHTSGGNKFYSLLYLFWWWKYHNKWSLCCVDAFWLNS